MCKPARVALLLLLTLGFVRLSAAPSDELVALRAKAERGNALAQYNLGLVYVQGRLAPTDLAEGFAWLTLASESGATGKALDSLLGTISDAQLAEGRRRLGLYRTALTARNEAMARRANPKLPTRGFTIEPVPDPATAAKETPVVVTKAPEAVATPISTSPAEGSSDLAQSRKDLEKVRAELQVANAELITLRTSVARLEAAAAEAKLTEIRLAAELAAAQQQLSNSKPITSFAPPEKPKAGDPAPPRS